MDVKELIEAWRRILMISEKPEPKEYVLMLRIVIAGLVTVGILGLIIHYVLYTMQGGHGG